MFLELMNAAGYIPQEIVRHDVRYSTRTVLQGVALPRLKQGQNTVMKYVSMSKPHTDMGLMFSNQVSRPIVLQTEGQYSSNLWSSALSNRHDVVTQSYLELCIRSFNLLK